MFRVARDDNPDLDIPMNAAPNSNPIIPDTLSKYFTLDNDLQPIGVRFKDQSGKWSQFLAFG